MTTHPEAQKSSHSTRAIEGSRIDLAGFCTGLWYIVAQRIVIIDFTAVTAMLPQQFDVSVYCIHTTYC